MAGPKKNYYVDKNHPEDGVYKGWQEASLKKAKGGTNFFGFVTMDEAKNFMISCMAADSENSDDDITSLGVEKISDYPKCYAFTDGSFNAKTGEYGYGGFVVANGEKHPIMGSANESDAAKSRNVAGEVLGAIAAVEEAKRLGIEELTLYYDYEGIRAWAVGEWKTNINLTREYADFMRGCDIKLHFVHVKAHTGIPGNEEADAMAKEAVGL